MHDLVWCRVKVKGVDVQSGNRLSSSKPLNGQLLGDGAKDFAVKVQVMALELEIFDPLFRLFFFTHLILKTSGFTTAWTGREDVAVGLEQRPQQVIRDFAFFQKRSETG